MYKRQTFFIIIPLFAGDFHLSAPKPEKNFENPVYFPFPAHIKRGALLLFMSSHYVIDARPVKLHQRQQRICLRIARSVLILVDSLYRPQAEVFSDLLYRQMPCLLSTSFLYQFNAYILKLRIFLSEFGGVRPEIFRQITVIPVSYTHLDVYKRQGLDCCEQRSGDNSLQRHGCKSYRYRGRQTHCFA